MISGFSALACGLVRDLRLGIWAGLHPFIFSIGGLGDSGSKIGGLGDSGSKMHFLPSRLMNTGLRILRRLTLLRHQWKLKPGRTCRDAPMHVDVCNSTSYVCMCACMYVCMLACIVLFRGPMYVVYVCSLITIYKRGMFVCVCLL